MATTTLLDTSTKNLSEIFSNGRVYRIPPFQRDYSWKNEHWEDLWSDVDSLKSQQQPHYLGAIVLQQQEKNYIVIDGQQRMATLSILILVLLNKIKDLEKQGVDSEANKERYALLYNQYIGGKDPASLKYASKLNLNKKDDTFYQQNLVNFRKPMNERKLTVSEKKLWEAYKFFSEQVNKKFGKESDGEVIAEFIAETIGKNIIFIQILVQDELSAYTVFETLNARGLELTATDLLKNYLFSLMAGSDPDMSHVEMQWRKITDIVGMGSFPDFLRHYLNSQQAFVRAERLFKAIREKIRTRDDAFALLDALEKAAYWYRALNEPQDELWLDYPSCKEFVRYLKLFKVTQYRPLILACIGKNEDDVFLSRVLRACMIISFRFNVICQRSTHILEDKYNKVAIDLTNGRIKTDSEVIKKLMPIYISDEEFKNSFEIVDVSTRSKGKLVTYILCALEKYKSNRDCDYETTDATIEHILPENPGAGWDEFTEEDREKFICRLGNMTLLESGLNRSIGNQSFNDKKPTYEKSAYGITSSINYPAWTQEAIFQRQREMSKWALTVWRIDI